MPSQIYFTAEGSVRGSCGHKHQTIRTAVLCRLKDGRDLRRFHGQTAYTDRTVHKYVNGEPVPMTDAENDEAFDVEDAARALRGLSL